METIVEVRTECSSPRDSESNDFASAKDMKLSMFDEEELKGLMEMEADKIPMGMKLDREYSAEELSQMDFWTRNWYHNYVIREHFVAQKECKGLMKDLSK